MDVVETRRGLRMKFSSRLRDVVRALSGSAHIRIRAREDRMPRPRPGGNGKEPGWRKRGISSRCSRRSASSAPA